MGQELLQLWQEREAFLAVLEHLPQTVCHLDAWHANVFITHTLPTDMRVVAVDWAFVGIGAVGQEIAPLIGMSWINGDSGMPDAIDERVVAAYLEGLRASGWQGSEQEVRLGYTIAMALTYGLGGLGFILGIVLDERQHAWWEQVTGHSIEAGLETTALAGMSLQRADRARRLHWP
jgi:hypothetical protein